MYYLQFFYYLLITINKWTLANKTIDSWTDFPYCRCSVAKSCLTFCDARDCGTPGSFFLHYWEVVKWLDIGKTARQIHEWLTFFFFLVTSTFYTVLLVLKFCLNITYEIRISETSDPFNSVLVFSLIICILSTSLKFPWKRNSSCWSWW